MNVACVPCPPLLHAHHWRLHHAHRAIGRARPWHALGLAGAIAGGCCSSGAWLAQQRALAAPPVPAWISPAPGAGEFFGSPLPASLAAGAGPGFVAGGVASPWIATTPAYAAGEATEIPAARAQLAAAPSPLPEPAGMLLIIPALGALFRWRK